MLTRFRKTESVYDEPIAKLRDEMLVYGPVSPEYPALHDQFVELTKLRHEEQRARKVKPEALAAVAGNLLGILVIISYEHAHVITSKGLSFVRPNQV